MSILVRDWNRKARVARESRRSREEKGERSAMSGLGASPKETAYCSTFSPLLSNSAKGRSRADWIRTSDLHHPKVARYPGCATARNRASTVVKTPAAHNSSSHPHFFQGILRVLADPRGDHRSFWLLHRHPAFLLGSPRSRRESPKSRRRPQVPARCMTRTKRLPPLSETYPGDTVSRAGCSDRPRSPRNRGGRGGERPRQARAHHPLRMLPAREIAK